MEDLKEEKIVDQPHSVKFGINAKGLFSAECKVYAITPEEALKKCTEIAAQVEQIIKAKNML